MNTVEILLLVGWALTVFAGISRILFGREAKLTRIVELLTSEIEELPLQILMDREGGSVDTSFVTRELKRSIESYSDEALEEVLAPFIRRAEAHRRSLEGSQDEPGHV